MGMMGTKRLHLASDRKATGLWASLIFLVSLNLRPSIAAVGPVLERIGSDLGWAGGLQGLLAAIPLVAFAAVSPLVPSLTSRIGVDCTILLALIAIALGDVIRSFTGGVGIWVGTVMFASAIAVGNVLVPVIAKRDYADHIATATGIYSACITCGSAAAGLTASAMAQAWGGWRYALAFWAVLPLIVAVLWTARIVHSWRDAAFDACNALRQMPMTASDGSGCSMPALLHRPMTWWVTLFMGTQSSAFYTMSNWMPSVSEHAGFGATAAGVHLFVFQFTGIFSGLLIPRLMRIHGSQICAAVASSLPMVVAGVGMLALPAGMPLWAFIGGIGQGASLVVALALIAMRGRTAAETVRLSGFAQSIGYLIASLGPLLFGALYQLTGAYVVSLTVMTAIAVAQCVVAVLAGHDDA